MVRRTSGDGNKRHLEVLKLVNQILSIGSEVMIVRLDAIRILFTR